MRALKTVLIILFSIVAIVLVLGFLVGPASTVVERSAVIKAPPEVIYPMVASLRTMHEWGPWKDMEKGQVNRWEGEDGTVGSVQFWEGDTVGKGSQRIVDLEQDRLVRTELSFIEPWEATSAVTLLLDRMDDGTRITWTMAQDNNFMGRIFALFLDMDKMIGPDLEQGLANLAAMAEVAEAERQADLAARTFKGYLMEQVERPATIYVGRRVKGLKWDALEDLVLETLPAVRNALTAMGVDMNGPATAIYFDWDERTRTTDIMLAYPVEEVPATQIPGLIVYEAPASACMQTTHQGSVEYVELAHAALDEMIRTRGLEHYGNVFEVYRIGLMNEPDMAKWVTEVQYMIR